MWLAKFAQNSLEVINLMVKLYSLRLTTVVFPIRFSERFTCIIELSHRTNEVTFQHFLICWLETPRENLLYEIPVQNYD